MAITGADSVNPLTEFATVAGPAADLSLLISRLGSALYLLFAAWGLFGVIGQMAEHGHLPWSVIAWACIRIAIAVSAALFVFS